MKDFVILLAMILVIASVYFFEGLVTGIGVALGVAMTGYSDEIATRLSRK